MRFIRFILLIDLLAAATMGAVVSFLLGAPLAAARRLGPGGLAVVVSLGGITVLALGGLLLGRSMVRPLERLLETAGRLGAQAGLPVLSPDGDRAVPLGRAVVAFERVAAALGEERSRLTANVAALQVANVALTEARESWARSERLAAVGLLGTGIAHEVGNPLGAITGYAEVARARVPPGADPELAGALDRIAAAAARIDGIIRDLLDFARPSPPHVEPVAVGAVVDGALRLAQVQRRFKGVSVQLALPDDLPPVIADAQRLTQVLLNLLLNAADAAGDAGHLEICARPCSRPGAVGEVELTVSDDGPGIAVVPLERVFEPFFTTKGPERGTGLGLAVSRVLVESFGGALSAANRESGGARFMVRLRAVARGAEVRA